MDAANIKPGTDPTTDDDQQIDLLPAITLARN